MKFKRNVFCFVLICVCMLATGCGEKMYPLTEQETDIIALYSAKMVAKFNKNQEIGYCNARTSDEELGKVTEAVEEIPTEPLDIPVELPEEDTEEIIQTPEINMDQQPANEATPTDGYTLTEAFGIDGLEFWMNSIEVTDVYAAADFYVMSASKGMKYCIVTFDVENVSSNDVYVDMLSSKNSYTLTINGSYKSTSQTTVLDNDLTTYQGTIKRGASQNLIMVFQFKEKELEKDILNIDFVVQSNGVAKKASL